jgi:hypothetical protein
MKLIFIPLTALLLNCTSAPGPVVPASATERQMIGLLEKFDRWDFDGNGQLTASELVEAEKLSGHTPEKIIAFYDSNRNGSISLREAQTGYARAGEAESSTQR